MNNLIATLRWEYVAVYLDDIVIFSLSRSNHNGHVAEIPSTPDAAHSYGFSSKMYDCCSPDTIT